MQYLEEEISIGGKRLSLLRFLLFIGSAVGLFLSLTFQLIRIYSISDAENERGPNGGFPGWIPGRWMDQNDHQWNNWRETIPTLLATMAIFLSLSYFVRRKQERGEWPKSTQIKFYCVVGVFAGFFIHGTDAVFPLILIVINYFIARAVRHLPEPVANAIIWLYNGSCLLVTSNLEFYAMNNLFPSLRTLTFNYEGFARWHIYYKLAMLRQISFSLDYQQAYRRTQQTSLIRSDKYELAELRQFGLVSLLGYTFYLPLYIAGPIAPFSVFIRDCEVRQTKVSLKSILWMFLQVVVYTIGVEIWLHYIYVYSWQYFGNWLDFSPALLSMICFWTLHHMFVKFTVIWRTFRALSLIDGIGVTENMQKCISNTNSFQGFWRCWHASFSEWLVRYIYLPLGGRSRRVVGLWLIFLFVGAWHEVSSNWMAFALFNAFGITIESLCREFFYKSGQNIIDTSRTSWPIRIIEALVGAMNVALLILSNFAINQGFERMSSFVYYAFFQSWEAVWNLVLSWAFLVMITTQFYSNPWNSANEENTTRKKAL